MTVRSGHEGAVLSVQDQTVGHRPPGDAIEVCVVVREVSEDNLIHCPCEPVRSPFDTAG